MQSGRDRRTGLARPCAFRPWRWSARWISSAIFGFYILAYYGGAIPASTLQDWNETLPKLYEADAPAASTGIGAHFFDGAILLLLGPVQLIGGIRQKVLDVHRWTGRAYAFAAVAAGVGGLGCRLIMSKP